MATAEQSPSAALLRLRASDVVRLCGLNAAASGLDLASSHHIVACQRDGSRLLATVTGKPTYAVWVEVADELDGTRWACDCSHTGPLACEHVAATLSAWVAHPGDFTANVSETLAEVTAGQPFDQTRPLAPPSDTAGAPQVETFSAKTLTLEVALARMNASDIAAIARRVLGPDGTAETQDLRKSVIATLSDPALLQALLRQLEPPARELLTLVDLAGGTMTAADLAGLAPRIARPLSAVQGDIAVLERHALLLPMLPSSVPSQRGQGATWRHVAGWRIPDEVRRAHITSLPLASLPTQSEARLAPPLVDASNAPLHATRNTPRALCLALALLAHAPPPLGLPRMVAATDDAAPPARQGVGLLVPGELVPERLRELARNAGIEVGCARLARRLLRQSRELHPAPPIADLARVPVAERPLILRAAFRRWLRTDSAADLLDIESSSGVRVCYATAHPAFRPAAIAHEVSAARRFIARLISCAQPETWYALDDLIHLAWQINPGLLRGQQQTWATPAWWLESTDKKRALQVHIPDDWTIAEGAFIRSLLAGALAVWGAVDLATRGDGTVAAFRLTSFGAFLLQRASGPADASLATLCDADWGPPVLPLRAGTLAVQPLAAQAQLLDALALWASPTAVSGKRLVYTLSLDRACAAFDQQLSPASLPALLRPLHSRAAESVASQLNQWHTQWGRTRITTGFTLVEANDEATLVEALAAAPDVAARCRRIGPTLALALPDDAAMLRILLARRGFAV